jgi:hypothetical protein
MIIKRFVTVFGSLHGTPEMLCISNIPQTMGSVQQDLLMDFTVSLLQDQIIIFQIA